MMAFQESAESMRAKLHLSDASVPLIIGVGCLILVAVGVAAFTVWGALSGEGFSVEEGDGTSFEAQQTGIDEIEELTETTVMVHVSGAVVSPGLVELPESARVHDAVQAAGGMTQNASSDSLNLARVITDGEQIIVPTIEEQQALEAASQSVSGAGVAGKVNINTATVDQLDTLPGVGESTAQKIIADREANGPFSSPEDLKRVSGIGDKKYEELADLISVG